MFFRPIFPKSSAYSYCSYDSLIFCFKLKLLIDLGERKKWEGDEIHKDDENEKTTSYFYLASELFFSCYFCAKPAFYMTVEKVNRFRGQRANF